MSGGFATSCVFLLAAMADHMVISRVPMILRMPGTGFIRGIALIGAIGAIGAIVMPGHAGSASEAAVGFIAVPQGAGSVADGHVVTDACGRCSMTTGNRKRGADGGFAHA